MISRNLKDEDYIRSRFKLANLIFIKLLNIKRATLKSLFLYLT